MENFIEQYKEEKIGVLNGFDHISIRGYIKDFHIDSKFYYFLSREICIATEKGEEIIIRILLFKKMDLRATYAI